LFGIQALDQGRADQTAMTGDPDPLAVQGI